MNIDDLLKKYQVEFEKDIKIDQINLRDIQMRLPALKHKWIARLINNKQKINELGKLKYVTKQEAFDKLKDEGAIGLSHIALEKKIEQFDDIKNINNKVKDLKLVVEYLEKIEQIMKTVTYDVSNLIKIMELEEL